MLNILNYVSSNWNAQSWLEIEQVLRKRTPILITDVNVEEPNIIKWLEDNEYVQSCDNKFQDFNFRTLVNFFTSIHT